MKRLLSRRLLFVLSLLAAVFFSFVLFELQMLPLKYYVPIVVVIFILLLLLYVGERDKDNEHTIRTAFLKLIHILLSIVLVIASLYAMKGSDFLAAITGGSDQTIEMDVVVLKSSSYQSLEDLKGLSFGANTAMDAVNINKTETLIEDEIGDIEIQAYTTHGDAIDALKNGTIQAMVIKAVDYETLDDVEANFQDDTRVVETFEIKIPSVKANSAEVTQEPFMVFISGTDKEGPINTFALSDVNIIAAINPQTKQVLLLSIPRDYFVDIIGMDGVNGKDKLTHSAKGGIECTLKTVENLMGVEFNYYAKLNFTSFMNVIDALGGITVDVPKYDVIGRDDGVFTTKLDKYTIAPGINEFDSKHALSFVRERKAFVDGDAIRGKNQMLMIKAIIKKCCSSAIVTSLNDVFESLEDSFETNMEASDIKALINMQIDDMASWDVQSYRLEGTSMRTFHLATVGDVSKVNPKGIYITEPSGESLEKANEYLQVIMNGNEILKVEDD